jgi:GNAT superfamily N-acetyltransferase
VSEVHLAGSGLPHRVLVAGHLVPGSPLLWYVLVPAPDAPEQVDLIAFSTADRAEGDVLDEAGFAELGLAWSNQVGAIRWNARTGLVGQVYVAPPVRRRGVATKLGGVAFVIAHGRGWAALHGDDRRTDLGAAWLSGVRAGTWVDLPERGRWAPPMTPAEEADGVPLRNLQPDPG